MQSSVRELHSEEPWALPKLGPSSGYWSAPPPTSGKQGAHRAGSPARGVAAATAATHVSLDVPLVPCYLSCSLDVPLAVRLRGVAGLPALGLSPAGVRVSVGLADRQGQEMDLQGFFSWQDRAASEQWVVLSRDIRDLPLDCRLLVRIYRSDGFSEPVLLGTCSFPIWNKKSMLKQGEKLLFAWLSANDANATMPLTSSSSSSTSSTLPSSASMYQIRRNRSDSIRNRSPTPGQTAEGASGPASLLSASLPKRNGGRPQWPGEHRSAYAAYLRRIEKMLGAWERQEVAQIHWRDKIAIAGLAELRQSLRERLQGELYVYIEFPSLPHQVLHYHPPLLASPEAGHSSTHPSPVSPRLHTAGSRLSVPGSLRSLSPSWLESHKLNFSGPSRVLVADPEAGLDNPLDVMSAKLRLRGRGTMQTTLTHEQRQLLLRICDYPPNRKLAIEERTFLWEARTLLQGSSKRAIPQLLAAVDWTDEIQSKEALKLLSSWPCIDVDDCFELLGSAYRAISVEAHVSIRQYAGKCLANVDDLTLSNYLLQLSQAVRYEQPESKEPDATAQASSSESITAAAIISASAASTASERTYNFSDASTPLVSFLVARATSSPALIGSSLYWLYRVETLHPDPSAPAVGWYKAILNELLGQMLHRGQGRWAEVFHAQRMFVEKLFAITTHLKNARSSRKAEERMLRNMVSAEGAYNLTAIRPPLLLPIQPAIMLTGVIASRVKVFKSAMKPLMLPFNCIPVSSSSSSSAPSFAAFAAFGNRLSSVGSSDAKIETKPSGPSQAPPDFSSSTRDEAPNTYTLIYKRGDDLRQDQLVLQMIGLMDGILKRQNLDLMLTPYRVLATSWADGLLECVNAHGFQDVLKQYRGDIQLYLRAHQPDPEAEFGIKARAIDTFVRSCAGSAVVTYLLGIGDRHLDNLMMTPEGHLFHIDFGFILGREPPGKLPSGAMKFNKEMVQAMGGLASAHYLHFKEHCCEAYNILRKSAKLILNLFSLMADSDIPDIKFFGVSRCLMRLQEKFLLGASDADAASAFQLLINQSLGAIGARVNDTVHRIAQSVRS